MSQDSPLNSGLVVQSLYGAVKNVFMHLTIHG